MRKFVGTQYKLRDLRAANEREGNDKDENNATDYWQQQLSTISANATTCYL